MGSVCLPLLAVLIMPGAACFSFPRAAALARGFGVGILPQRLRWDHCGYAATIKSRGLAPRPREGGRNRLGFHLRHKLCTSVLPLSLSTAAASDAASPEGSVFGEGGNERHIVVVCHDVSEEVVRGAFRPNNLLEGRVDVMCRCLCAALYYSNGVRKDTRLWLVLQPRSVVVGVWGGEVFGLNPDEKTMALFLQRALEIEEFMREMKVEKEMAAKRESGEVGQEQEEDTSVQSFFRGEKKGGITKSDRNLARKQRERRKAAQARWEVGQDGNPMPPPGFHVLRGMELGDLLERLTSGHGNGVLNPVLWLHEEGSHLGLHTSGGGGGRVVVVGDQLGYTVEEEALLKGLAGVKKVSLGARSLLASQCIVLLHHYLDGDNQY